MKTSVFYSDSNFYDLVDKHVSMFNKLHYYGAYVAGGCLRDLVLYKNKEFNDIDIFAPVQHKEEVLDICHSYLYGLSGPGSGGDNFSSYKFVDDDGRKHDVVFVEDHEEWINTFDLSVNRIWAELYNGYIYMKEDAAQYLEDGCVFIYYDNLDVNNPLGHTRRRMKRLLGGINEKYICSNKYKSLRSPLLHEEVKRGAAMNLRLHDLMEVYSSTINYSELKVDAAEDPPVENNNEVLENVEE